MGLNSPRLKSESNTGILREFEKILRELEPLAEQGKVEGFFNNVKNADKLSGLVEDIRDTVMEYQVSNQGERAFPIPDICFRLRYNKTPTIRTANSS